MSIRSIARAVVLGVLVVLPGSARGQLTVASGYDLFQTEAAGTSFPGLGNLMGVPLGTYDFGSGPVNTGMTDTIIQRLSPVTVAAAGDSGTTSLLMNALQLETVAPVDFGGAGVDNYFVTLQSAHGGPSSTGTMDITFASAAGGTFTSSLDVFFDIHKGSLTGGIVFSGDLVLANSGDSWSRIAPPGSVLIDGVNNKLDGTDTAQDFWPGIPLVEQHPNGAVHTVMEGSVPEPASLTLLGVGAIGLGAWARRRQDA